MGGAGLVNFECKDTALKFSWVKNIMSDSFMNEFAYYNINSNLKDQIWKCNLSPDDVKWLGVKNKFWNSVVMAWSGLNYQKHVPPDEIPYQYIWYNSHVRVNEKPWFNKTMYRNGLETVLQILNLDGTVKNPAQIAEEFGCNILQANQLVTALLKEWKYIKQIADPDDVHQLAEDIDSIKKTTAFAYRRLTEHFSAVGKCFYKWSKYFEDLPIETIENAFKNIYKHTNYTKLRSFQFRLLHQALVFNKELFYWKMSNSKLCSNCNKEIENVFHFYWECEFAQQIWKEITQYLELEFNQEIHINAQTIIFGNINERPESPLNMIFLAAKSLMYSKRCLKEQCSPKNIIDYYKTCKNFEEINAMRQQKMHIHCQKWGNDETIDEYGARYLEYKD